MIKLINKSVQATQIFKMVYFLYNINYLYRRNKIYNVAQYHFSSFHHFLS
jgi:hypothetical protein